MTDACTGPAPGKFRSFFAEVFATLDARPRRAVVKLLEGGVTVDLVEGNPVFSDGRGESAAADFRRRWIAEHPVPMKLSRGDCLTFTPASGNRVKVRRSTLWERWFGWRAGA